MNNSFITDIVFSSCVDLTCQAQHKHSLYQLIYIIKGTVILSAGGSEYRACSPCLIFISNLEPHSICSITPEYERYIISIDPSGAEAKLKNTYLLSVFSTHRKNFCHVLDVTPINDRVGALISIMYEERTKYNNVTLDEDWKLLSVLLGQVSYLSPDIFHDPPRGIELTVEKIKSELEAGPSVELNLDELAEKYYSSRYYLAHSFKKFTGYGIKQYQLRCRLSLARNLLVSTCHSIAKIAELSGYNSASNFSRYFKDLYQCSPSQYRERYSP